MHAYGECGAAVACESRAARGRPEKRCAANCARRESSPGRTHGKLVWCGSTRCATSTAQFALAPMGCTLALRASGQRQRQSIGLSWRKKQKRERERERRDARAGKRTKLTALEVFPGAPTSINWAFSEAKQKPDALDVAWPSAKVLINVAQSKPGARVITRARKRAMTSAINQGAEAEKHNLICKSSPPSRPCSNGGSYHNEMSATGLMTQWVKAFGKFRNCHVATWQANRRAGPPCAR